MSRTIMELAAASNITDTSTVDSGGSSTIYADIGGQEWKTRVIQYAEDSRYMDQFAIIDKTMVGTGAKTVTIPKSTTNLSITTSQTEGDVRTITEMTDLDAVDLTVAASDFKYGEIAITKQIFMTSTVDLIAQARYKIAQALARDLDTGVVSALESGASSTSTNHAYGGDATTPATLAAGDTMTPDVIANGMEILESNNFEPAYLILDPKQIRDLRKDPQFVNASEYGSNIVVMKGEIGTYLGLKVFKSTNVPEYSASETDTAQSSSAWAVAGKIGLLIGTLKGGEPCAYAIAWKELPNVDYEYDKDEALHRVYYDQCFKVGVIHNAAYCFLYTTDS
jgi:N4-gp56 family major capsid protein